MARYFAAMSSMSFQMNIDAGYTMMGQRPFQKQSGKALNAATKRIQEELPKMTTNMVNVYFYGKKYSVPADLTIMTAMEYAGIHLKARLRLPPRLLRCLRDDLPDQGQK